MAPAKNPPPRARQGRPATNKAQPVTSSSAPIKQPPVSRPPAPKPAIEPQRSLTLHGVTTGTLRTVGDIHELDSASWLWIGIVITLGVVIGVGPTLRHRKSKTR